MAFTANTMFEVLNSNISRDSQENVSGKFGTNTGDSFSAADCDAGTLVVANGNMPIEGYESVVDTNGNPKFVNNRTYYMNVAADGTSGGAYGDRTGIYFANTYDVSKATSTDGSGNIWNIGFNTLGLGTPAGEYGNFTQVMIGDTYAVGAGNFSTLPTDDTYVYATIVNGKLVATDTLPSGGDGVYFDLAVATIPVNFGSTYWGEKYKITARRTAEA